MVEILGPGNMSRSSIVLLGVGLAAAMLIVYFNFVSLAFDDWSDRGAFGDTFNALLSAGALAGVMIAILLQREELKHQREDLDLQKKELEATRKVLEASREAQEAQAQTMLITAKLNAYSYVLTNIHADMSAGAVGQYLTRLNSEKVDYTNKLNQVLIELENQSS